ncbi:hypothetical protein [Massilia horti]|uniref:Uncharacterized protein n=1 Tax=Massilia horti TaxID=2562153 RepID=A0A4Y9SWB3_9BURK|nr:hypothetical protein [Massilia horti]TFW29504.1 hypothetical protein E4O92_18325 [Massilia horti]
MQEGTDLLVDHYQKTYEVTLHVWNERNRTFLLLLAVVGGATLLTFNASQAQPLLVDLIAKFLSIADAGRRDELRGSFPYGLVQSILLMVVLYLTLLLYHRTTFIKRSYRYLGVLEDEIRAGLGVAPASSAFTREGTFYLRQQLPLSRFVGMTYVVMLGLLLGAFLGMRIYTDLLSGSLWFALVDLVLALPTLLFFGAYARASQ